MPPESADLVYVFRPLVELPRILDDSEADEALRRFGVSQGLDAAGQRDPRGCAPTLDSEEWRRQVETAGLQYVEDAYIGDVVRTANRLALNLGSGPKGIPHFFALGEHPTAGKKSAAEALSL